MITRRTALTSLAAGALTAGGAGYYGWTSGRIRVGPIDLPEASLPPVANVAFKGAPVPGFDSKMRHEKPLLINFWASWCPYCRAEHDELMMLAEDARFMLIGIVKDDSAEKVASYLKASGNPFAALSVDAKGALTRPMRQRGIPSTLLIPKGQTRVSFSHLGPLTPAIISGGLEPALKALS